jgi:mRNA deadenylase 3'-5' endonuclease subunit Ccr4
MHWNILADSLAFDSFPKVPDSLLQWNYRFPLIMEHIKQVDPDCLGLSEVDLPPIKEQVEAALEQLGYATFFFPKPNNVSGSLIGFKKELFVCREKGCQLFQGDS